MKRLVLLSLLGCVGCGVAGDDVTAVIGDECIFDSLPGDLTDAPEMGFFNTDEEADDEAAEAGALQQAWRSARYHGSRDRGSAHISATPCFKDPGPYHCMFPTRKQFELFLDTSACPSDIHQSGTQNNEVWIGARIGITELAPGDSTLSVVTVASFRQANLILKCFDANDYATEPQGALAYTDNFGSSHTMISNLPGEPVRAVQYDKAEIRIALDRVISKAAACRPVLSPRAWASTVGLHEMGHVTGFGHFASGLMRSAPLCGTFPAGFPQPMKDALTHYSGTAGSTAIVEDNLESMGL